MQDSGDAGNEEEVTEDDGNVRVRRGNKRKWSRKRKRRRGRRGRRVVQDFGDARNEEEV